MSSRYKGVWKGAMLTELEGLRISNTFATVEKPAGREAIEPKWVCKWKTDQAGYVVKAKARLLAKDHSQIEGI